MKETLIGGQALLEGVMTKGPKKIGIAVRTPKGVIKTKVLPFTSILEKKKFLNIPFIRGPIVIYEMMLIGIKALNISAAYAYPEEAPKNPAKQNSTWMYGTALFSIIAALVIFKAIPLGAAELTNAFVVLSPLWYAVIEGAAKIAVFIIYLSLITMLPDIYRVWQYHGAEHKVVRAFEEKKKLSPEHVQACTRLHPRCGTSFVIFVILLSILVYVWIPTSWAWWTKLLVRIALLPVLAGLSYELLRLAGRYPNSIIFRVISAPGLATQLLTTREPDKKQLEVAIKALQVSLK